MSNLRRYYIPHSMIFITTATNNRNPIFNSPQNIRILIDTIKNVRCLYPFELTAFVILPDHLHFIIQLPENQDNFSIIMKSIKGNFTVNYKKSHQIQDQITIWQKRFWDHVIRDEKDLQRHLDYVHWNPVKHNYVDSPQKWPNSSFDDWVKKGLYAPDWGLGVEPNSIRKMNLE